MDQSCPQVAQVAQATKHHPMLAPLQITPEIESWEREVEEVDGRPHQPINPTQSLPIQAATTAVVTDSSNITTISPPFSVREPVEKQVRNWLESTSDEYDILLKRLVHLAVVHVKIC